MIYKSVEKMANDYFTKTMSMCHKKITKKNNKKTKPEMIPVESPDSTAKRTQKIPLLNRLAPGNHIILKLLYSSFQAFKGDNL